MSKFRFCSLIMILCIAFILFFGQLAFADGSSADSSGGSGAGGDFSAQSIVSATNSGASEDDQKKQKEFESGFPEVDPTGAFQYQYPINLPPGTQGMAPSLSLFYNSNSPNGMLGMGWNLNGIVKIERDYSYPVSYNDSSDHFMYNGEKLVKDSSGYYHPAKESYERIEFINQNSNTSYWIITQKSGTKLFFGYQATEHTSTTNGGRIEGLNISGSDAAIVWSLSKVKDLQGNYYVIEYTTDGTTGAYYPTRITYTKNENYSIPYTRTVEFLYVTRNDHYVVYNPTYTDMQRRLRWIKVKMNGQLLRAYRLDYYYATSTGRSRLSSVQEYGSDGYVPTSFPWCDPGFPASGKTLPPQYFYYQEGPTNSFTSCYSNTIYSFPGLDSYAKVFSFDYNGDGKSDVCYYSYTKDRIIIAKSNGDGSFSSVYDSSSGIDGINLNCLYTQVFPFDYNGDGKEDLCFYGPAFHWIYIVKSNGDGTFSRAYYSGSGIAGFDLSKSTDKVFPLDYDGDGIIELGLFRTGEKLIIAKYDDISGTYSQKYSLSTSYKQVFSSDFSGDGRTDICLYNKDTGAFVIKKSIGDGTFTDGWTGSSSDTFKSDKIFTFDFNGDGKADLFFSNSATGLTTIMRSDGNGSFTSVYSSSSSIAGYDLHSLGGTVFPFDYNGDGKMDLLLCCSSQITIAKSNGDGTFTSVYSSTSNIAGFSLVNISREFSFDYNGDGIDELCLYDCMTMDNAIVRPSGGLPPDLMLYSLNDGSRGITYITYQSAPQVTGAVIPSNNKYPNIANTAPCPLVTEISHDDGSGPEHRIKYSYSYYNGTIHTGTSDQRTNLGFSWIEKTNENTGDSTRTYYYKNLTNSLCLDFRFLVPRVEIYGPNHLLYLTKDYYYYSRTTVNNDNTSNPQLPSAKFIYKYEEKTYNYNGEGLSNPIQYHITYDYDDHGNLKRKTDEGDVSFTTDDVEYDAYFDYNDTNNLSLLGWEKIYGYILSTNGQGLISETDYYYKPNFLLDYKIMQNGVNSVTNSYGYDNYGNVTSITDGRGYTTSQQYDSNYKTYIVSITNPKNQVETIHYDNLMNPYETIDANGALWQTTYDVFSRKKTEIAPGDDSANPTIRITYPDDDEFLVSGKPGFPNRQRIKKRISGTSYLEYDTYYDGMMRVIQKKTKAQNGWTTIDYSYDNNGRLSKTSVPYFSSVGAYTTSTYISGQITFGYDSIGRVVSRINSDMTIIRNIYGKQETKTIDENGHVTSKMITGNIALGQQLDNSGSQEPKTPVLNTEYDKRFTGTYPGSEYSRMTKITYGDAIQITDFQGKVFTDKFDALGRKISSDSPVSGSWTYGYDRNNNLISQTDNKNQTITMIYDELNRISEKDYPDGSKVNYYYDEGDHSIGRLTRVVYLGGQESYTYDARGRIISQTQTIDGNSRTKNMTYNSIDQINTITYPDGEVVTYGFDQGGKVNSLTGNSPYVSTVDYTPFDRMNSILYGNGVQTNYDYYDSLAEYDSTAGTYYSYCLRQIRALKNGSDLLNLTYQYDKTGNVKVKTDSIHSNFSESYSYDDLNRLTSATSGLSGSRIYNYDELDNITQKDGRSYQYDTTNPYKLTSDGRFTYTYDANGNMSGRSDGRIIDWDFENRVTSVSDEGSYVYNDKGQRIEKSDNNGDGCKTTFTRNSAAYLPNGSMVGVNQPRYGSSKSGFGQAVLVEEGMTNYIPNDANADGLPDGFSLWNRRGVTPEVKEGMLVTGIPGIALHIKDTSAATQISACQSIEGSTTLNQSCAGSQFTVSFWVKGTYGSGCSAGAIAVNFYDANNVYISTQSSYSWQVTATATRQSYTVAAPVNAYKAHVAIYLVEGLDTGESYDVYCGGLQFEQKSYPTSWQMGGTTRASESFSISSAGLNNTEGSIEWLFCRNVSWKSWGFYLSWTNFHIEYNSSGGVIIYNPTYGPSYTSTISPGVFARYCLTWKNGTIKLYENGILKATGTNQTITLGDTVYFGSNVGATQYFANGYFDDIRLSKIARDPAIDNPGLTAPLPVDQNTVFKSGSDGITHYYFFPEYEEEWQGEVKTNTVKYYFVNDQRIAESSTVNGIMYYIKERLGSAVVITDSNGNIKLTKAYQPYGSEAYSQGSPDVTYKFTNKEMDNSELIYFGARYYDPEVGRFISPDPIKSGSNWFSYCNNSPTNLIDSTGLMTEIDEDGNVINVTDDDDLGIYQIDSNGNRTLIGESWCWDSFNAKDQDGNYICHINIGVDKTSLVMDMGKDALGRPVWDVAEDSGPGKKYDIKQKLGAAEGYLLEGKYGSGEDIGNFLAGLNAGTHFIPFSMFQRMAGALHQGHGSTKDKVKAGLGIEVYGDPPTYGETMLQYKMSAYGWSDRSWRNFMIYWFGKVGTAPLPDWPSF